MKRAGAFCVGHMVLKNGPQRYGRNHMVGTELNQTKYRVRRHKATATVLSAGDSHWRQMKPLSLGRQWWMFLGVDL